MKKKEIEDYINEDFFISVVNGKPMSLKIERVNKFKKNFQELTIDETNTTIIFNFPFLKRKKIEVNGIWVDTEPLNINKISV
jgi:hypothetical protein